VGQRALEDPGHDLHVAVRVATEPLSRLHAILVDHPQVAEAHPLRIVIVGEREGVKALEPAMLGMAAVVGLAQCDHDRSISSGKQTVAAETTAIVRMIRL
jgi:hypothetical protein